MVRILMCPSLGCPSLGCLFSSEDIMMHFEEICHEKVSYNRDVL